MLPLSEPTYFIFHGLLNRFPSVGSFPVEMVYFIWKPMEMSNVEEILLDPHLDGLPFSLSIDTEPTSGRWSNWILVFFMFSPLSMWRLIVLTSIYAMDLWMEHIFPKRIIKILQDLGQLSLVPGGKLFPLKTSPSYPDFEYPTWLKISWPNSFSHLNVQFVPQDLE